jgi:signal transduction histidine kinase/CheY-like chemotaxis protein
MLVGYYESSLVALSVLVAVLASYTTLTLAERVASADGRAARWWIAGGALAMGSGIWSMHFVGMLAFRLPIALGYDLFITLLSWVLPVMVSALALWRLSRPHPTGSELALSAVLIGLGINAMHYVGMAAMRMQPAIVWDVPLVGASVAIAIAASGAALWIALRLRGQRGRRRWLTRLGAAVLMGSAIVGMHYTGMAAAGFPLGSVCTAATGYFSLAQLAALVILATFGILAIALLTSMYDARMNARATVLAISEQTARERQTLLEREREARAESERLSALKDEFLATLSHELRTPLNVILGWAQILRAKQDDDTVLKGVQIIERNARLQAQLIGDLLDMSRIVSGHVRLEMQRVDPWTVVEAAVEAARPAAFAKRIEMATHVDHQGGPVWADPARLQQVMWNLLSNATKFTPEGGRIDVSLRAQAGHLVAEVADNGAGITADFLPFVFDRFRQADASTSRRHGGLGLGLAIAKQLAELHGGTVAAFSEGAGRGARFVVTLPLAAPSPASTVSQPIALESRAAFGSENLSNIDVLVVDDELDARNLLDHLLSSRGAVVRTAQSADEAMQRLEERMPDVFVIDIAMPVTDGFMLIRSIRSRPDAAGIAAIALTAFTRREDEERALREGFDLYLSKPLEAQVLVAAVDRLARRTSAKAESP